jgi:hypothetical protein
MMMLMLPLPPAAALLMMSHKMLQHTVLLSKNNNYRLYTKGTTQKTDNFTAKTKLIIVKFCWEDQLKKLVI